MILQQYYTRERRGIFRTTDGYDTIAKSPSLDKNLVKKIFHSYCFYDGPRELQVTGEKDSNKYPKALTFIQLDTNEAILGQSVYVPVDFTGQRSTFFTHNYLLSKDIKEAFIKNPEQILYANEFQESYDIEKGIDLPETTDLAYTKQNYNMDFTNNLFEELGITEALFKDLIYAIWMSVTSRKKVYIALDVEASEISTYSKKLLLCILESFPYELRRKVGFTSYIQKPESKKGINVMFVDKESIRHGTSGSEKDFIFDFQTKRFSNIKIDDELHPYLDFVWNNRGNKNRNISLYEFIDKVLSHSNQQSLVDISTYNNLCVLHQVIEGNSSIYSTFKDQLFEYILCYLNEKNVSQQIILTNLAISIIKKELGSVKADGSCISVKFGQNLIPYYSLENQEDKMYISNLFLSSLLNAKNTGKKEYILELFEILQRNKPLINQVINQIIRTPQIKDYILNDYIQARLDKIKTIDQWGKEIEILRQTAYEIIEEPYFQKKSAEIVLGILGKQQNIISSGKKVYNLLENFGRGSARPSDTRYVGYIEPQVDEIILNNTSIRNITKNDLINLKISPSNGSNKLKILYALKDLVILKEFHAGRTIKDILNNVPDSNKQEIQEAMKNLVMESPDNSFYDQLILAFYKEQTPNGEDYNYGQLLTFIFSKKGRESVYNFIFWSMEKEGFYNKSTKSFYKGYEVAIKNYFIKLDPGAFKNKELKQRFLNSTRPRIRKFFVGVNQDLATGFEKIYIKYGDVIRVGTKYVLIIGILGTAVAFGTIKITEIILEKKNPPIIVEEENKPEDNKPKDERSPEEKFRAEWPQYEQFWMNRLEKEQQDNQDSQDVDVPENKDTEIKPEIKPEIEP